MEYVVKHNGMNRKQRRAQLVKDRKLAKELKKKGGEKNVQNESDGSGSNTAA